MPSFTIVVVQTPVAREQDASPTKTNQKKNLGLAGPVTEGDDSPTVRWLLRPAKGPAPTAARSAMAMSVMTTSRVKSNIVDSGPQISLVSRT